MPSNAEEFKKWLKAEREQRYKHMRIHAQSGQYSEAKDCQTSAAVIKLVLEKLKDYQF